MISYHTHPGFRLFFLGAGFSVPAGLPLANDLYRQVIDTIENEVGEDSAFHTDIKRYIKYIKKTQGQTISEKELSLEKIMTFLDIEHSLVLRGSETWSNEGNKGQLLVKKAIGKVIQKQTPDIDKLAECYYRFAESLSINDVVFTFNYDNVLERSLEYIKKPFRLYPTRYTKDINSRLHVDNDQKEILIIKLHGSVDWFSISQYQRMKNHTNIRLNSIFENDSNYKVIPLVDCPIDQDNPLKKLHKICDIDTYYNNLDFGSIDTPFILSPSYVKFLYLEPLLEFLYSMNRIGGWNLGVNIIGFSLSEHDEYIKQILYHIITNYQEVFWDSPILDVLKENVKFVDFKKSTKEIKNYMKRYMFSDPRKSEYWFSGFSNEAVRFIFQCTRNGKINNKT